MKTPTVSVTKKDIQTAKANHSNPITLALKRVYKTSKVRTYSDGVAVVRGTTLILPDSVTSFLQNYYRGSNVSSIRFTPTSTR